jgi:hypothetical protein
MRIRSTILVSVPRPMIDRYRAAVQRFAVGEHKWRHLKLDYISVMVDTAHSGTNVKVLVDAFADSDETDSAGEAADEAAVRALVSLKLTDLASSRATQIIR